MKEISFENSSELESRRRTTTLIFAAAFALTIVLVVASLFIKPNAESEVSNETLQTLRLVIIFIAIGTFVLRRMFTRWDRLRDIALLKGGSGLLRTLQSNAIILAILAETVVALGFVISLLSGERDDTLRAGVVALILLWINYPRKTVWNKIATNLQEV